MIDECKWKAPSVGYQNGCRCNRCQGWRDGMNLIRKEASRARRLAARRPIVRSMIWTPRSATTFYNDALDAIDRRRS